MIQNNKYNPVINDLQSIDWDTANVFDLTNDIDLIRISLSYPKLTKEEVKTGFTNTGRILTMLEFAEYIKDYQLIRKLETIYKKDIDSIFNE